MNLLRSLTIKDLKLNKKRTIGTIIGVILSCALITVVGEGFYTLRNTLLQSEINNSGYYHIRIKNVTQSDVDDIKNNRKIKEVITDVNIGYTKYDLKSNYSYYGDVYSLDFETFKKLNYNLLEGEFPKNSNEILINRSYMYQNDLKIGDTFEMEVSDNFKNDEDGERLVLEEPLKIKMTVSGIIENYGDLITTGYEKDNYNAYIILKNPQNHKEDISSILGVTNYQKEKSGKYDEYYVNSQLILFETFDFDDVILSVLLTFVCIVIFIIIVASIFSIRNSFAISVSEKMKTYGMLRSIGATKKQIKYMVVFEGFIIGLVGVIIGVVLGEAVSLLLCYFVNVVAKNANLFNDNVEIFYKFSFVPIIVSVLLSFVVIYGSIVPLARKAGKISPINSIRNSDDLKNKKFDVPSIISKIFGIGGVISYKNLKRSKKKYRVTILSLTSCIFIFIIASSFMGYALRTIKEEYQDLGYNIIVNGNGNVTDDTKKTISNMKGAYVNYGAFFKDDDYYMFTDYDKITSKTVLNTYNDSDEPRVYVNLELYNEYAFKEYVQRNNLDYEKVKDKIIILNEVRDRETELTENRRRAYKKITNYEVGESVTFTNTEESTISYEIGALLRDCPVGGHCSLTESNVLTIIGCVDYIPHKDLLEIYMGTIYFDSDEPYELAKSLKELDSNLYIDNLEEEANQIRTVIFILGVIVYGFIIVVTFIGITSVFNTINSNMELRSQEFATFKSIGMTKKEFNNMINLEAIFYSFKSLFYGIVLGVIGSVIIHKLIMKNYDFEYVFPIEPIIISCLFIVIIVLLIMKYSVSKINKQNIIETIRCSNV